MRWSPLSHWVVSCPPWLATLKARLNKRLQRLARWADSSADERHSEFRTAQHGSGYPYRTLVKPMIYSKPFALTSGPASPAPVSRPPTTVSTGTNNPLVTLGRAQPVPIPIGMKVAAPTKLILSWWLWVSVTANAILPVQCSLQFWE